MTPAKPYALWLRASAGPYVAHVQEPAGAVDAWVKEGEERGIRLDGERLRPPTHAKVLRIRDGEQLVTDGPFSEGKEWIAGYDILDCKDIAEAIDYASRHPIGSARTNRDPPVLATVESSGVLDSHKNSWQHPAITVGAPGPAPVSSERRAHSIGA